MLPIVFFCEERDNGNKNGNQISDRLTRLYNF